jgi:hypothetical protein
MRTVIAACSLSVLMLASQAEAASLCWDPTADGFFSLTYSQFETGPFQVLKEVPANPPCIPIAEFGFYKITIPNGGPSSNVAHYSLDVETGWQATVAALEARVKALEGGTTPPTTTSTVIVKTLSATAVEISCVSGVRPSQVLVGEKRVVTCTQ